MRSVIISFYLLRSFLISRMSYRVDFFAALAASLASSLTGLFFLYFLLLGSGLAELGGWSKFEVLFLYGLSYLPTSLFAIIAPNLYQFGDKYVIQGQFDRVLLRPINSLLQVLSETFNFESLGNFTVGVLTIAYAVSKLGLTLSMLDLLLIGLFSVAGAVILLSVFVIVASMSFHFEDRLGIAPPFYNLLNFTRYPLSIFNAPLRFFLSWIVPFGFVAFYPASVFFEKQEALSLYSPLVAVVFGGLALVAWRLGERAYSSTGN
jgi:ABC-2 type transport system permease protein